MCIGGRGVGQIKWLHIWKLIIVIKVKQPLNSGNLNGVNSFPGLM